MKLLLVAVTAVLLVGFTPPNNAEPVLRLQVDVSEYGLRGTGTIVVDRRSGYYARHFSVGPASDAEGYDGRNAWTADASGGVYNQGNADTRAKILWWAKRLQHLSAGPETANVRVGDEDEDIVFSEYSSVKNAGRIPFVITIHDKRGTRVIRVVKVKLLPALGATAFEAPTLPQDATIKNASGIASIPLLPERFHGRTLPLIVVLGRVDNGPPMRFLVDTGGQNIMTSEAARRLHIASLGSAYAGGVGAGRVRYSFGWVKTLRIGDAQLRHQSFMILPLGGLLPDISGIVGAELLSHFAARFEFGSNRLLLAQRAPQSWFTDGVISTIAFDARMPDIAGSFDGSAGRFTLDTGSIGGIDINAPFAHAHRLYVRSGSSKNITGIGGSVHVERTVAQSVRLGMLRMRNVPATLAYSAGGVTGDPSVAGNVGEKIFRRYRNVLFDYAKQLIVFQPGGI